MIELLLETQRFMHNQSKQCEHLLNEYIHENFTDVGCPPSFDGFMCWPRTLAPGVAILNCPPKSIMGERNSDNPVATKTCLENGTWYINEKQVTWSNYTLCISPDGGYITENIDIEFDSGDEEFGNRTTVVRQWLPIIKTVSQIGNASSFTSLVIAMAVFSLLRRLRNPRNRLHMHLFASFIMRDFMVLLKYWLFVDGVSPPWDIVTVEGKGNYLRLDNLWVCKAMTSIWQYFIVSNYAWIFMEGLYLHNLVFLDLCTDPPPITKYALWAWVLPSLVVVAWIVARILMDDTFCWTMNIKPSILLIIEIPTLISSLCNFCLFINTVRLLLVKMKTSVNLQRKEMKYGRWAKSTLLLVPVFGVHNVLFLGLSFANDIRVELIWIFCDQLFGSFQGAFIACLYCLLNGEVRVEVARAWKTQKARWGVDLFILSNRKPTKSPDIGTGHDDGNTDRDHENASLNVSTL